jgi:hypothetical protein
MSTTTATSPAVSSDSVNDASQENINMHATDNSADASPLSMRPADRAARGESLTEEEEGALLASDPAEFLAYLAAGRAYLKGALASATAPKVPGKRGPQGPQRGKEVTLADGRKMIVGAGLGKRAAFNAAKGALSARAELLPGDALNIALVTFGPDGSGVLYTVNGVSGETPRGKGSPGVSLHCTRMDNGEEVVLFPTMDSIANAVCITGSAALLAVLPVLQAQKVRGARAAKAPATV